LAKSKEAAGYQSLDQVVQEVIPFLSPYWTDQIREFLDWMSFLIGQSSYHSQWEVIGLFVSSSTPDIAGATTK